MGKTYNGLTRPILLFDKKSETLIPLPGLQPSYGIWESLESAKQGLIEEFESISNVPKGYTFAIINRMSLPEEWWFTEDGNWNTIEKKGVSLIMLNIDGTQLQISYDGGWTWIPVGDIADSSSLTEQIVLNVTPDGIIRMSFDSGTTWTNAGQIKLRISDSGYLYITYDNWAHETLVGKVGGTSQGPSGDGASQLGNLDSTNVGEIDYEGINDEESHTYTGQEACDLLVYFGIDQLNELNNYFNTNYPNANIGDFVIIRSSLFDRTGGMSNDSDGTHTYELDPDWTTQEILSNNSQDDWYHYYKVTKVAEGVWAALAWIGRVPVFQDTTYYALTIGSVNPQDAVVTVSYGDVIHTVQSGDTINIPEGVAVTITAERQGYDTYTDTFTMSQDETVNIELQQSFSGYTVTIGNPINRSTGAAISNGYELEYRYYDSGHVIRGRRVYPGETFTVQPNEEIYVLGTATGYYDWYYGGSEGVWVPITQNTTIVPSFAKIPDTKAKIFLNVMSEDYDPIEGTRITGGPGKYDGHYEVEYWINDAHYIVDKRELGNSIEVDKGDYFECYIRVVGSTIPWNEEHKSRQKITKNTTLIFHFLPENYTTLSFLNASPSNIIIHVNNTSSVHTADNSVFFHYGATVHIEGSANGYITKSWDLVMPEQDKYIPVLALDPA